PSLRDGPRPENQISYSIHNVIHHKNRRRFAGQVPLPTTEKRRRPRPKAGSSVAFNDGCCNYSSSSLWVVLWSVV
ncbi:hypothetical protein ACJWP5_29070, partial [Klebsiella pneumoniae]